MSVQGTPFSSGTPLNGSSSLQQVESAFDDSASYAETNDPAKARTYITACRILIRRYPRSAGNGPNHTQLNPDLLQKEIEKAEQWLEANDTQSPQVSGPRVTRVSFENFRQY